MTGRERFLAACAGRPVDATPVWFMRQAGGRLARHVALRERHSVLAIATDPALCAEVSVAAVDELGVDGAVLYADIMLLAAAMGVRFELTDQGPVLDTPIRSLAAVSALRQPDIDADLAPVLTALGLVRAAVGDRAAVIGIAGGPFTLASYLIEGGPSRDHLHARAIIQAEPDTWRRLLDATATATADYVRAQERAGADVITVFDTWASVLTPHEYASSVAPYTRRIIDAVTVPVIHHVARSATLLDELAVDGCDVHSIDSRQSLAAVRQRLGSGRAVQGNLDAATILAGWRFAADGARAVLAAGGGDGHLFSLGEPVPRDADPAILRALTYLVHEASVRA